MTVKACVIFVLLTWISAVGASNLPPYDEHSDPDAEFATALDQARSASKKVLVIFGSNWCPDCRTFDQQLQKEPLKSLIEREFMVVKADIGNWDRNMGFADRFGNPAKEGIPSIAIVDSGQERYYATRSSELAQVRHQPIGRLADWFARLAEGAHEKSALKHGF
jgi:thiol-disulfide isomerase/thioredoxin